MNEVDEMHYPSKKKGPTKGETVARMGFVRDRFLEDIKMVGNLKTEFPINREVWDSLTTVTHLMETCVVEMDIAKGSFADTMKGRR